jgi:hypothetical protein
MSKNLSIENIYRQSSILFLGFPMPKMVQNRPPRRCPAQPPKNGNNLKS